MLNRVLKTIASLVLIIIMGGASMSLAAGSKRVPAEWEPQEATWLQWPGRWEKSYETAFARVSGIISRYQKLHILYSSKKVLSDARKAIAREGGNPDHANIVWHAIPNDSAWMRDNGPVYVVEDGKMRIQNWEFDAWGGAFGADVPFHNDNTVPQAVGDYLGLPVDNVNIVHERGNLEFNGVDTVIVNWSTLGDPRRNAGYTKERAEADLKHYFGVSRVVFIEGVPEGDLTNGHVDGIARFINPTTVVVPLCTANSQCKSDDGSTGSIFEAAAAEIERAGFSVIRDPIEGSVRHELVSFDTNYMNWLVGNGFVIAVGFGNEELDNAAKKRLQGYFPDREIYVVEMLESWLEGGGVHCHTNDQPLL